MRAPLLVVEEAFAARGGSVQLSPRITVAQDAPRATFPVRLRLSEARSFITSARLVTDPAFARELYVRGLRLLDDVTIRCSP